MRREKRQDDKVLKVVSIEIVCGGVCTYLHHSYVNRLAPTLAHLLGGLQELMGWSFCILIGGPMPETGGNIEACSLHVGSSNLGYTFDQAYPDFALNIMCLFRSFLDQVSGELSIVRNDKLELTNLQCCAPSRMLTKSSRTHQQGRIGWIPASQRVPVTWRSMILLMLWDVLGLVSNSQHQTVIHWTC